MATVTGFGSAGTTFPAASRTVTSTAGLSACPTVVALGCTVNSSRSAAPGVTVTLAVPSTPSTVAVMVAVPTSAACTRPFPSTPATGESLEAHVTVRPVSGLPPASRGVAVSCTVAPDASVVAGGVTSTLATDTAVTVTLAVPSTPSTVAVTVTGPGATAVRSPVVSIVAIAPSLVLHATVRFVSALPPASRGVAVNCWVPPAVRVTVAGVTSTLATGTAATVTLAVPSTPSTVAVTVTGPGATAVNRPVLSIVAMVPSLVAHVTARPVSAFPPASRGVAVNCCVPPAVTVAVGGVTSTLATLDTAVAENAAMRRPPMSARTVCGWPAAPSVHCTVAWPWPSVTTEVSESVPPPAVTCQVTVTAGTPLSKRSAARATSGTGSAAPGCPACPSPLSATSVVAAPGRAVAENVATACGRRVARASMVLGPATVPNVYRTAATPLESVIAESLDSDPPPVTTAKATEMPGTPFPRRSVTCARRLSKRTSPTIPSWLSPAATASAVGTGCTTMLAPTLAVVTPPPVAVTAICATPGALATTAPVAPTDAMLSSELVQFSVTPGGSVSNGRPS